jgi:hypothetical protein
MLFKRIQTRPQRRKEAKEDTKKKLLLDGARGVEGISSLRLPLFLCFFAVAFFWGQA